MPRDFRIERWRPPFSPGGALRSRIQVSIKDETPTSISCDVPLPGMRCVNTAVICLPFRKSISRITMLLISSDVAPVKLESGSTTTTDGGETGRPADA